MMNFVQSLLDLLGPGGVLTEAADRTAFETDWRKIHRHAALCVALPRSVAEVAGVVKLAAAAGV
jgi:FAD/FMN-containing dehydrogenase